jgi:phosphinothricin acetyltransferase
MTAPVTIRPATLEDADAICRIYNQGIEDRIATLETELRTPEERGQRLARKGRGQQHLARLIEQARELGYHKLVLSAFPWNEGGMALYRKFGFRTVGIYQEQGKLDGRWVDTIIMEKLLE